MDGTGRREGGAEDALIEKGDDCERRVSACVVLTAVTTTTTTTMDDIEADGRERTTYHGDGGAGLCLTGGDARPFTVAARVRWTIGSEVVEVVEFAVAVVVGVLVRMDGGIEVEVEVKLPP